MVNAKNLSRRRFLAGICLVSVSVAIPLERASAFFNMGAFMKNRSKAPYNGYVPAVLNLEGADFFKAQGAQNPGIAIAIALIL